MSALLLLLAVGGSFTAVAAASWWLCLEGIHQGDDPADVVTGVTGRSTGWGFDPQRARNQPGAHFHGGVREHPLRWAYRHE
jgi:hypothetical protein